MPSVKLTRVYPLVEDENETEDTIDVFAIHGLDTTSNKTWTWKDNPKDPYDLGVNWLADKHMLPNKIPNASIFTCDWPAELFESLDSPKYAFEELARLLLDSLLRSHRKGRPILFIASCLGGIILVKALDMATDRYDIIKKDTRVTIFLATPFQGTAFDEVAEWAQPGLEVWAKCKGKRLNDRLEFAKSGFDLVELVRKFTGFATDLSIEVSTFYEAKQSEKILFRKKQLVSRESGTLYCDRNPLPLDRSHVQMNKFRGGDDDEDYQRVVGRIEQSLKKVQTETPLQKADKGILKHYNTNRRLDIIRLSGDVLDMAECYINHTISSSNKEYHTSSFSPHDRLNVKEPDKEHDYKLSTLFNSRPDTNGGKPPRRILIRGRAGVGKTTLCKKIVHDFTQKKLWVETFRCILWMPLRDLKQEKYWDCINFATAFQHMYFQHDIDGKALADALWHEVNDNNPSKYLFILDGLDEVGGLLHENHEAYNLLAYLLNRPNVIITGRQHAKLPSTIQKVDLELGTVGFYSDQVHTYIEKVVRDAKTIQEILSFLQKHRLMGNLVQIPIQLDALCFIWNNGLEADAIPETMTAVYLAIERCLWRNDTKRLNGPKADSSDLISGSEMGDIMEYEMEILECMAFTGMYNSMVDFQAKHRDAVSKLIKSKRNGRILDQRLGDLSFGTTSFLRTSSPLSPSSMQHISYHFLHLTFQEFFAAKYFVRQWRSKSDLYYEDLETNMPSKVELTAFLRREKYTGRYDIMWRFVAGLFSPNEVPDFFDLIEKESIDLMGPTHQRIIMHCLNETNNLEIKMRPELELRLSQWLLMGEELKLRPNLIAEPELPDNSLLIALKNGSDRQKKDILQYLREVKRHLSVKVVTELVTIIKDKVGSVKEEAAKVLGCQPNMTEAAIMMLDSIYNRKSYKQLIAAENGTTAAHPNSLEEMIKELFSLEYTTSYADAVATEALRHNLSEATVAICLRLIQHENPFRHRAAEALKRQEYLSTTNCSVLVSFIEDGCNDPVAQYTIAEALWKQGILSEMVITILATRRTVGTRREFYIDRCPTDLSQTTILELLRIITGENHTKVVRLIAASALQLQKNPPQATVTTLIRIIQDKHSSEEVRDAAACGIQLNAISTLERLVENKCLDITILIAAAMGLRYQVNLSETTVLELIEIFKDNTNDQNVRLDVGYVLESQESIKPNAIAALVRLIRDGSESEMVRIEALKVLEHQKRLLPEIVTGLIELLSINEEGLCHIRSVVADVLRLHDLEKPAINTLLMLFQNQRDRTTAKYSARILGRQTNLSNEIVEEILEYDHYGGRSREGRHNIFLALRKQTNLSTTAITALTKIVEGNSDQYDLTQTLGNQRESTLPKASIRCLLTSFHQNGYTPHDNFSESLSDQIARGMKSILETAEPRESYDLFKYFYRTFLQRGYYENFSMYLEDDDLVIYLPSGERVRIKVPSRDIVTEAINSVRHPYLEKYPNLWPDRLPNSQVQPRQPAARESEFWNATANLVHFMLALATVWPLWLFKLVIQSMRRGKDTSG